MTTFLYLGQNAINIGHQVEKVQGILGISVDSPLYIEDVKMTKYTGCNDDKDSYMMLQYIEMIDNQLRMTLESSTLSVNQNIIFVTDLSVSNLSDLILVNIHDYFPGLPVHCIYLSQQSSSSNSVTALKTIKKIYTALHLCDSIVIRETKDVIQCFEKENKQYFQQTDIDFFIACDIVSGYCCSYITDDMVTLSPPYIDTSNNTSLMNWPFYVFSHHHKFIDVRSSLWKCLYYQKKRKDMLSTAGVDSSSVTDQFHSLRSLSSNLASLHQCYFPSTITGADVTSSSSALSLTTDEMLLQMNKRILFGSMQDSSSTVVVPFSVVTLSSVAPSSSCCDRLSLASTNIANNGSNISSSKTKSTTKRNSDSNNKTNNDSSNIKDIKVNVHTTTSPVSSSSSSTSLLNLHSLNESIYNASEVISALSTATISPSSSSSSPYHFNWCNVESFYIDSSSSNRTNKNKYNNNRVPAAATVYTRPQQQHSKGTTNSSSKSNSNNRNTISYEAVAFASPYALCFVAHACRVSQELLRMGAYQHSIESHDASYQDYKDCLAALNLKLFSDS